MSIIYFQEKSSWVLAWIIVLFCCFFLDAMQEYLSVNYVKEQLAEMVALDQEVRSRFDVHNVDESMISEMQKIDHSNTEKLKQILNTYTWVTISEFGKEADRNAWLLVQHVDHDIEFQKEVLVRLEKLYPLGETSAKNFAYLYDRVAQNEGRPQRYGTQGQIVNGKWVLYSTEDLDNLDVRRNVVGLSSYEEYLCQINRAYNLK